MPAEIFFQNRFVSLRHNEVDLFIFLILGALKKIDIEEKDEEWIGELKELWIESVLHDPNNLRFLCLDELLSDIPKRDFMLSLIEIAKDFINEHLELVPKENVNNMIHEIHDEFDEFWAVSRDMTKEYYSHILEEVKGLLISNNPF